MTLRPSSGQAPAATPPRKLGRYELVEPLGQGGMGEVWLARLSGAGGFEKPCIVKTVLPAIAQDRQFTQRFTHEARVLVHLAHSNIAQVYEMGEEGGALFMALEYVAGVDVARLCAQVASNHELLPVPVALHIAQQAAEGLGYAHRRATADGTALSIVHRDVSPHNVMLSYEGEVKVIDFGIAKSAAKSHSTQTATVMGKLGYMAPEQARAEDVDARADQYALGVMLWEMLTGQSYVRSGTVGEMMAAMANPRPQPLSKLRSEVTSELEAVVAKALSPNPGDRYARTDDLARALLGQLAQMGLPSKEQVGEYVRDRCREAYEANQKLLSRLTTVRVDTGGAEASEALARTRITAKATPAAPVDAGSKVVAPQSSRTPVLVLGALLCLCAAALVAVLRPKGTPSGAEPEPGGTLPTPSSSAQPAVAAPSASPSSAAVAFEPNEPVPVADGNSRPPSIPNAAPAEPSVPPVAKEAPDPAPPKPKKTGPLKAALKLQRTPVWSLTVTNTSGFGWSQCKIFIPGKMKFVLKSLPAGAAREIPMQSFVADPAAVELQDAVRIECAQGSVVLPAR